MGDAGLGSLRRAIYDANASPGADLIAFAIPGAGVRTIAPTSALPAITDRVTIAGHTQPGFAGAPLIELSGGPGSSAKHGLVIFVAEFILFAVSFVFGLLPVIGCLAPILWVIVLIAAIVIAILCIVKGINGERFLIPGLSQFADRF